MTKEDLPAPPPDHECDIIPITYDKSSSPPMRATIRMHPPPTRTIPSPSRPRVPPYRADRLGELLRRKADLLDQWAELMNELKRLDLEP